MMEVARNIRLGFLLVQGNMDSTNNEIPSSYFLFISVRTIFLILINIEFHFKEVLSVIFQTRS
jgi:hypothetical protein